MPANEGGTEHPKLRMSLGTGTIEPRKTARPGQFFSDNFEIGAAQRFRCKTNGGAGGETDPTFPSEGDEFGAVHDVDPMVNPLDAKDLDTVTNMLVGFGLIDIAVRSQPVAHLPCPGIEAGEFLWEGSHFRVIEPDSNQFVANALAFHEHLHGLLAGTIAMETQNVGDAQSQFFFRVAGGGVQNLHHTIL